MRLFKRGREGERERGENIQKIRHRRAENGLLDGLA